MIEIIAGYLYILGGLLLAALLVNHPPREGFKTREIIVGAIAWPLVTPLGIAKAILKIMSRGDNRK